MVPIDRQLERQLVLLASHLAERLRAVRGVTCQHTCPLMTAEISLAVKPCIFILVEITIPVQMVLGVGG
jgi:hypothetical protein